VRYEHRRSLSECAASSHHCGVRDLPHCIARGGGGARGWWSHPWQRARPDRHADSGASITVRGPVVRYLRAGEDGRFVVELLPQGEYTIRATLAGFAPSTRRVEIVYGATAAVALILVPEILEQVTVTAERTGERELQKVPMAVSVLSGAQLRQRSDAASHGRAACSRSRTAIGNRC
jgi:hypothetical protein